MSSADLPVVELRHEVLEGGAERPRRRWPWAVLAVLVILAAGAWWLDGRARVDELAAFETRVDSGQLAVAQAEAHVSAMLAYGNPVLSRADLPPPLRVSLERVVERASSEGADALRQERAAVLATQVRPWHDDLAAAVAAYADYLEARIVSFDAGGADMQAGFVVHPEHATLLQVARTAAERAAAGDPDAVTRLDALLRDPSSF